MLTPEEAAAVINADGKYRDVLFPYMNGRDLVEDNAPTRWIIDLG